MSQIILSSALPVPTPVEAITIRPGNVGDIEFIDGLQKQFNKQLGFMRTSWIEGKIKLNQILIAETGAERVGYIIAQDRYFKRDDVGIVYQLVVAPGKQRGFIGSALLQAQFERSAYGCRLYCCWCAQDIEANRFWESMGFFPLAYRQGSEAKGRVHIFWQKKIRGKEDAIHWWYPSKTDAGAMNADRIVLPIKPGTDWREVKPIVLPTIGGERLIETTIKTTKTKEKPKIRDVRAPLMGGLRFVSPITQPEVKIEKPKRPKKAKTKIDPKFISLARELRDRYLEKVNEEGYSLEANGKYDLTRRIAKGGENTMPLLEAA